MTEKRNNNSIKENLFERIEKDEVKMRPNSYFLAKSALAMLGLTIIVTSVVYLVSFVFFVLERNGAWILTSFGWKGIGIFLMSFPWILGLAVIVFIISLELLVKRVTFAYRAPIVYSMLGIVVVVFTIGFAVSKTSVHHGLYSQSRDGSVPIAGSLYRHYGKMKFHNTLIGMISGVEDGKLLVETLEGDIVTVTGVSDFDFPQIRNIKVNDAIIVIGLRDGLEIKASDIRKIDKYIDSMPPHFRARMQSY